MGTNLNCSYSKITMEDSVKISSKSSLMQIFLGLITNFSNISSGLTLAFSAIALPALQNQVTPEEASWIASVAAIVMPVGCLMSGSILDKFGRKMALYAINVFALVGWTIIALASHERDLQYIMLLLGRVVTGVSVGIGSIPATVYVSEICTPELRDILATWTGVFIAIGNLIVFMLGYFLQDSWRTTAVICACFPFVTFVGIYIFVPESPQWLVSKNRIEEAETSLARIHCVSPTSKIIQEQLETMVHNMQQNSNANGESFKSTVKYLLSPSCMKPFIILVTFLFFQQSSGTFVVVFYAVYIMTGLKSPIDSYVGTILLGVTRVVGSLSVGYICRKWGRRPPPILFGILMSISILGLTGYLGVLDNTEIITQETQAKLNWLPVTLLLLFFLFSTIGFMMIPFAMIGELYPTRVRGTLGGFTTCFGYIFNFTFVKTYPNMLDEIGRSGVFGFYTVMSIIGTIFVLICLPETKGKTLQEIEDSFKPKDKRKTIETIELDNDLCTKSKPVSE